MRRLLIILLAGQSMFITLKVRAQTGSHEIVFVSDTQKPMWVETVFLKADRNEEATSLILSDIIARRPETVFMLGDVVAVGSKPEQWKKMDQYLNRARKERIPVHALLGNHDVMYSTKKGEALFQLRFPEHHRLYQMYTVDSIAVIMLNSNFSTISEADQKTQQAWLKTTIQQIDNNPAVVMAVVTCHHAPFTNSKVVGMNNDVQKKFVPIFTTSNKGKLFITGHAHAFERFMMKDNKNYLTIGGGGGIHQPLNSGAGSLPEEASNYKPMFHYLTLRRNHSKVVITSIALRKDRSGFDVGYTFEISLN